jgi:hypothetical protein
VTRIRQILLVGVLVGAILVAPATSAFALGFGENCAGFSTPYRVCIRGQYTRLSGNRVRITSVTVVLINYNVAPEMCGQFAVLRGGPNGSILNGPSPQRCYPEAFGQRREWRWDTPHTLDAPATVCGAFLPWANRPCVSLS